MTFNQAHERHVNNLDNAFDLLLESREREVLQDEFIRDWILEDTALFQRLAEKYLDDPVNREGFLDFAIEMVKREREPQFTRAWEDDRTPNMYSWERSQRGE